MGEVQSYDWNMGHYLFFSRMICSLYSLSESGVSPFTLTGWLSTMAVITNGLYDYKFFNRLSEWWCISLTWLGQLNRLQTGQQKKNCKRKRNAFIVMPDATAGIDYTIDRRNKHNWKKKPKFVLCNYWNRSPDFFPASRHLNIYDRVLGQ